MVSFSVCGHCSVAIGSSPVDWKAVSSISIAVHPHACGERIAEEEVTQFLGRGWYERKGAVDAAPGYRNGYGKPRRLSTRCGTIKIKRPRVRGLKERFESRILPLFARRTKEVGALLPELYLHGLAQGDFELALRGLLGDGAPLSSASIARLRAVTV